MLSHLVKALTISMLFLFDAALAGDSSTTHASALQKDSAPSNSQAIKRINLPVQYQITRARIMGSEATTETENYRENWVLEMRTDGYSFLQSPRATVAVYLPKNSGPVSSVIMHEENLAKLVGVSQQTLRNEDSGDERFNEETSFNQEDEYLGKMVALKIDQKGNQARLNFNLSEAERMVVNLEIGTKAVF